jgi:aspartyl-tRNA(Asn)/glutamyl-tRNA(Gln) amidotransferase subunit A
LYDNRPMTIREAGRALRARQVSAAELTEECLRQIERENPRLNAFITVTAESARARAVELDRELASGTDRGPLHGIPIAHKDLLCTRGVRTTSGSKIFEDYVPDFDAAVVLKLDAAGAVMLGKTGLHELAYGITSNNPWFGTIRNPRDSERIPGGSSGGSAAAVATNMVFMATGTDTGGSIRIPASFCGVTGLKPTYERVSREGVKPLGMTLDHVGPIARTIDDTAICYRVMAGVDTPPKSAGKLRIGLPENFYFDGVDPEVRAAVQRAAKQAEDLGMQVIPVRVPDIDAINMAALVTLLSEAAAVFAPYMSDRSRFGPDVLALLDQGRAVSGPDYVNAQQRRRQAMGEFQRLFENIDALFTPATPLTAPLIGQTQVELDGQPFDVRMATTRFARAINLIGYPALAMPRGHTAGGLPIGLQIIGRPLQEETLLSIGEALEEK